MQQHPDGSEDYFRKSIEFLKQYCWIFAHPNTHILVHKILDNFPQEWIPYLKNLTTEELNNIPFGITSNGWPDSLKVLIDTIKALEFSPRSYSLELNSISLPKNVKISDKKAHEVILLAQVIHAECKAKNIKTIIDVGAGLGYLSQLLYKLFGYKVLAIEGNKQYYEFALQSQLNLYLSSKHDVKYVNYYITENSASEMKSLLQKCFAKWKEKDGVCITGLHACADLSVSILNIFHELEFAKCLVIMPCCYHRMGKTEEKFANFPASVALKRVFEETEAGSFLRTPFLRLACQQTRSSWKNMSRNDHDIHSKSCMLRAVLQEVVEEENCDVKRLKRKSGKVQAGSECEMQNYLDNLRGTHELLLRGEGSAPGVDDPVFKEKMLKSWSQRKELCYLVEVLTALQTFIQGMCEGIVLLDRVEFLRERGIECDVFKVTDDVTSPRCHALVATRP